MKNTKTLKMPDGTIFDVLFEDSPTFNSTTQDISYKIEHNIQNVELNALAHDFKGKQIEYDKYDSAGQNDDNSLSRILPSIAEGEYEKIKYLRNYANYLHADFYTEATCYKALLRWCADHYDFFINKVVGSINITEGDAYKKVHNLYPLAYQKDLKACLNVLEDVMNEEGTINNAALPLNVKTKIINYVSFEYIYGLPNPGNKEDFEYNTYYQEFFESTKQT